MPQDKWMCNVIITTILYFVNKEKELALLILLKGYAHSLQLTKVGK